MNAKPVAVTWFCVALLAVSACGDSPTQQTSSPKSPTGSESTPTRVEIVAPAANTVVSPPFLLKARCFDQKDQVLSTQWISYYRGATLLGAGDSVLVQSEAAGAQAYRAACTKNGKTAETTVNVTVNDLPVVSITSTSRQDIPWQPGDTITATVSASDAQGVESIKWYTRSGQEVGSGTKFVYRIASATDTPFKACATDPSGAAGCVEVSLTLTERPVVFSITLDAANPQNGERQISLMTENGSWKYGEIPTGGVAGHLRYWQALNEVMWMSEETFVRQRYGALSNETFSPPCQNGYLGTPSPDQTHLWFEMGNPDRGSDIYRTNPDGSGCVRVTYMGDPNCGSTLPYPCRGPSAMPMADNKGGVYYSIHEQTSPASGNSVLAYRSTSGQEMRVLVVPSTQWARAEGVSVGKILISHGVAFASSSLADYRLKVYDPASGQIKDVGPGYYGAMCGENLVAAQVSSLEIRLYDLNGNTVATLHPPAGRTLEEYLSCKMPR